MGFFFSSWAYRILCQCAIAESQLLKTLYVQVTALVIISNRRHIKSLSHNCSWLTWNSYGTFLGTLLDISHGLPYQLIRNEALFCCSVTQSCLTLFYPVGLQHTGLPCPSPSLRVCSNSCPVSQWCHPTISFSVIPFSSCLHLSQHQFFQWVSSLHQLVKVLELQLQHQSFQWIFRVDFF